MTKKSKYISFKEIELLVFSVDASQFSKFQTYLKSPTICNSTLTNIHGQTWGLTAIFKAKLHEKSALHFENVLFEDEQSNNLDILLNVGKITKFNKTINSGKVYFQGLMHNMQSLYCKLL